ncbi:hypothetical protein [Leifsonia xyli]|uniref:hypothetical protein n=1 Tax=Leifsonia xyli TaxID=1575 RepID=UPI00210C6B6E|nr:hypothetical protein [Leifsonia xyli]
MQMLGMLVWATFLILSTAPAFQHLTSSTFSAVNAVEFCILICIVGVSPFAIWGLLYKIRCDKPISWPTAALYGIGHWVYVGQIYITLCRAF